jgi:hypothetical protein
MARPPTAFSQAKLTEIAARTARGESAATVAAAMRMPRQARTIRRLQATLKGKPPRATHPAGRPAAPAPAVSKADIRGALLHAYASADKAEDVRAAAISLRRFDDPEFAAWLDQRLPVAEALSQSDPMTFDLLRTPEDVAYLARRAGDDLGCYEPGPGQTQAEIKAEVARESHGRAVALLEDALALLRRYPC